MLTIRDAQMNVLEQVAVDQLILSAVQHIRVSVPDVYEEMGFDRVRESVFLAKSKAANYGLETWSDLMGYLNVMYTLGFDFDEDPRYEWAKETLVSRDLSGAEKIHCLIQMPIKESETAHSSAVSD